MKSLLRFPTNPMEMEYRKLKIQNNQRFFKILIVLLIMIMIAEAAHAILFDLMFSLSTILVMIVLSLIVWKFSHRLGKWMDLFLSICSLTIYVVGINVAKQSAVLTAGFSGFLMGHVFGVFERIIVSELSRVEYKFLFCIVNMSVRVYMFFIDSPANTTYQPILLLLGFVVDYMREREDRSLFRMFFDYREELIKYRTLMVSELPTNVVIISHNLQQKLFSNECFDKTFQNEMKELSWSLETHFKKFIIEKDSLGQASKSAIDKGSDVEINVMDFLRVLNENRLMGDKEQKFSFNIKYKDHTAERHVTKIFEAKVFSFIWDGKEAIALTLNDITDHYAYLSLKVVDANKDKMIAMISHELRTPLNGILGMVQMMEKKITDSQLLTYLSVCKNSGKLLLNLVNSILDLGQIRNNKFKLSISKGNLQELLQDISYLFEYQFQQKGLYLRTEISQQVPHYIFTDLDRLRQIIINLVGNALKFTFEGGVTVSVDLSKAHNEIDFEVKDTGIGMKEKDKEKLFKMYGRIEQTDKDINRQGVGLGLTISDHLVKLLNNSKENGIKVDSQYEKGTTFSFSIKRKLPQGHDMSKSFHDDESSICIENDEEMLPKVATYVFSPSMNRGFTKQYLSLPFVFESSPSNHHRRSRLTNHGDMDFFDSSQTPQALSRDSTIQEVKQLLESPKEKEQILIVDDSPFNLVVARCLLENMNYQVKTALNGKLAIDAVKNVVESKKTFKAIIMDLQMPVMDGYQSTQALRTLMFEKKIPEIPIIALSANDTEDDKAKCKDIGMYDHISKPLREDKLRKLLDELSGKRA